MKKGVPYRARIGEKYNKLTIVDFKYENKQCYYLCKCDCGETRYIKCDNVIYGIARSCGCIRREDYEDLTGKKFGQLTVIKEAVVDKDYRGNKKWLCRCDCGNIAVVKGSYLKCGHTVSCGCYQRKRTSETRYKHGDSCDRLFNIYNKIKRRCYNHRCKNYKDYGERGISVCEEWLDKESGYLNFKKWALENGYEENLSIDRIDNNGNYEPSNCRWATYKIQANNKRNNRIIEINGVKKNATQWAEYFSVPVSRVYYRLKKNKSFDDIQNRGVINEYK